MNGENQPMSESLRQEEGLAPRSEKHEFLATLLKEARSDLIDFMFKQAAVITLILGWILSSKEAHEFIRANPFIRRIAIPSICLYFTLLAFWIWSYRQRSDSAYQHLLNLRYMPKEFYSSSHVTRPMALTLISAHFLLCAVLAVALLQIR
jgi:Ca2+/H+ antiporter